jgi:hypothetical protein
MSSFPCRQTAGFIDEATRNSLDTGFIIKPNTISISRINNSLGYIWCIIESWADFYRFKPRQVFFSFGSLNPASCIQPLWRDRRNWTDADMMRVAAVVDARKREGRPNKEETAPSGVVSEPIRSSAQTAKILGTSPRKVGGVRK